MEAKINDVVFFYEENETGITITGVSDPVDDVVIPSEIDGIPVTSIGERAFLECDNLTSVTIPNGVTSIGDEAFCDCSGLTSVTIPNGVTSIGGDAFNGCSGLASVTIPNGVASIGECAFANCGLTTVTILNGVTSIGERAFLECDNLTSVTIPNSVTSIGAGAFADCIGLTSVTIPNSVTSIGECAFANCGLTSVTIPNSVTSIGKGTFSFCRGLTSVEIPNSVTSIGELAFNFCSGLTNVIIPDSVTRIKDMAFHYCSRLKSITIPDNVVSIGRAAFRDCSNLTNVSLPGNFYGKGIFVRCARDLTITYRAATSASGAALAAATARPASMRSGSNNNTKRRKTMSQKIETRLRHAIELQKKCRRKMFYADNDQWESNVEFLNTTECIDDNIASLFAELEHSATGLPESVYYLAAKQLSDCRLMFLCKDEQKRIGYPQELWPKAPYIHPERLEKATFEELYPVEHLSTIFRLCVDLMDDCNLSFEDADAELIRGVLRFQFDSTKELLENAGYAFGDSSDDGQTVKPDRIISLKEHAVWG